MIMEINLDISTIMEIYDTMQFGKGCLSYNRTKLDETQ